MSFRLSKRSRQRLEGVHPDLREVIERAIRISTVDFGVSEGVRTLDRQAELVHAGASRSMRSRHLVQPHGFGGAVDVYAWVGGQARWELALYEQIARAVQKAANRIDVAITWGAAWPWYLDDRDPGDLVDDYIDMRRKEGRKPFIDGPHFQIEGAR